MASLVLGFPLQSAAGDSAAPAGVDKAHPPAQTRTDPAIRNLAPMVVSGGQSGPALWKVVAENGHALWVLGYVQPLPSGMDWQSGRVEALIAQAGVVLDSPSLVVGTDVGFLKGLTLLPAAMGVRHSPSGAKLGDLLPDSVYARWRAQKEKYLGWEWGIERWRPGFAADKLYDAALEKHGLGGGTIDPLVRRALGHAGLEITPVPFSVRIEQPRALMKEFTRVELDDVGCMVRTLDRLERGMAASLQRADAWAAGDVAALRGLPDERVSCLQEVMQSEFARKHGFEDIEGKVRAAWLDAAQEALAAHAVSFALLSMEGVLAPDGYLAALAGRGYRVEPPAGADVLPSGPGSEPAPPADGSTPAVPLAAPAPAPESHG